MARPNRSKHPKGTHKEPTATRQRVFAEAWMSNGNNATQAAIAAGYAAGSAHVTGARLLKSDKVRQIIEERTRETMAGMEVTTDRILKERARLALFDPRKLVDQDGKPIPLHKLDADTAAAIAGFEIAESGAVKYRLANKDAHLASLEKQLGMLSPDRVPGLPETPGSPMDMIEAARIVAFALARGVNELKH